MSLYSFCQNAADTREHVIPKWLHERSSADLSARADLDARRTAGGAE